MKLRFSTSIAALACVLIASCYPYNENQQKKQPTKPAEKTVTSPEQQKIRHVEYHKKYIFRAEYLDLLELFKIPYNERYIFEDLK